jgi:hypothetical protein
MSIPTKELERIILKLRYAVPSEWEPDRSEKEGIKAVMDEYADLREKYNAKSK